MAIPSAFALAIFNFNHAQTLWLSHIILRHNDENDSDQGITFSMVGNNRV